MAQKQYVAWEGAKTLYIDGGMNSEPLYWAGFMESTTGNVEGFRDKSTLSIHFIPDNIKDWFTMEVIYPGDNRYNTYGGSCGTTCYPICQTVVQANAPSVLTSFKIFLKDEEGTLSENNISAIFTPLSGGGSSSVTYINRYLNISYTNFIRNTASDSDTRSSVYLVTTMSPGTVLTATKNISNLKLSYTDLRNYGFLFRGDDIDEDMHGNVILQLTWNDDTLTNHGTITEESNMVYVTANILTVNDYSYTTPGLTDYSVIKTSNIYVWNLTVEPDWNNKIQIVQYNGYVYSTVTIANMSSNKNSPSTVTLSA